MKLSEVRAIVKAIDPDGTVSTRGLAEGTFAVRTDNAVTAITAALEDEGLELIDKDTEGTQWDWITVLWFEDA